VLGEQSPSTKLDLSSTEFVTAISHFFRGEMARANIWRTRLDTTTNWAIITTAAFLSFAFGSSENTHFVIILATVFVLFFLIIESRRYKYFDLWRWRVALVNENFFATVFAPSREPMYDNWRELLGEDLQHSQFKINFAEAFGRRLRRNYSWIFAVLGSCWFAKIYIHPTPIESFTDIFERAAIYHLIPGWLVIAIGAIFNGALVVIAIITLRPREEVVRIYPARKSRMKVLNI
jgi:uncharacterized membrane protein